MMFLRNAHGIERNIFCTLDSFTWFVQLNHKNTCYSRNILQRTTSYFLWGLFRAWTVHFYLGKEGESVLQFLPKYYFNTSMCTSSLECVYFSHLGPLCVCASTLIINKQISVLCHRVTGLVWQSIYKWIIPGMFEPAGCKYTSIFLKIFLIFSVAMIIERL